MEGRGVWSEVGWCRLWDGVVVVAGKLTVKLKIIYFHFPGRRPSHCIFFQAQKKEELAFSCIAWRLKVN